VLVAAARPREREELADAVGRLGPRNRPREYWLRLVGTLWDRGLIIDAGAADPKLDWLTELRRNWSRLGWHEAAEYHAITYDYPCLDYTESAAAVATDQARMRAYQGREPDDDRYKLEYADRRGIALPEPSPATPAGTGRSVWDGTIPPGKVDAAAFSAIVSLTFGSTGLRIPRTDAAPLLRRSVPSGGGRHPSEGYAIVCDIPGIGPGCYHITMKPFSLRDIGSDLALDDATLNWLFPETLPRFPFAVKALIVVTSRFERNMYRYREPRTFRTVHMDAGHVAGNLRLAARALGLVAGIYYCDAADRIERSLGIDGMREGYMLTVALADGPGPE
jgi:SagB-type dehydrogenase family enzyme